MSLQINLETQWFLQFFLVFSRISSVLASPIFAGPANVPLTVRIIIIAGVSYLISSTFNSLVQVGNIVDLAFLLVTEVINGLFLLLGIISAIYALELAGRLIDYQGGLSAASVFNPASKEQSSIFGTLLLYLFVFFFYSFDIHHQVLILLKYLFITFPIGHSLLDGGLLAVVTHLSRMAIFGVLISAPICITLFLIDVVAGLIAKSMPQINVYFLLLPVKVFVCLLMFMLTIKNSLLLFDQINVVMLDFLSFQL